MPIETVDTRAVKNAIKELLGKTDQLRRLL
jgi:hypothetical protein